ncbi:hypothetical protein SEUCBS140593_008692 [Sporothrix eucalyptigena]|uniref:Glucose receptor Git3 N-terminal domain-containing protein n=1 Tax=Sporothrix eucalyptigena TaxID=1812306 RepID=A0ABP0CNN7_9PEZI
MEIYDSKMLPPEVEDLRPLPPVLQQGLTAVAVVGSISLFASTALFCHLTFKIVRWKRRNAARSWVGAGSAADRNYREPPSPGFDLALGLSERHFHTDFDNMNSRSPPENTRSGSKKWPWMGRWGGRSKQETAPSRQKPELNQFLVLLYNLLLADMHQAMAFMLNAVWVKKDALEVDSSTCWAQGFFVSNGDLASSLFIAAIAIHTYSVISRDHKPPQWAVNAACIGIWAFTYGLAFIGIAATRNGATSGGFYVRASAWCWINQQFETLRLLTHYLFIFITLALTSLLYTLVFFSLRRRQKRQQRRHDQQLKLARGHQNRHPLSHIHSRKSSMDIRLATITVSSTGAAGSDYEAIDIETNDTETTVDESFRHPGFLIYPIIYVVCTLPLALGRIATMAGAEVPLSYFCASGALITSNGWLDVLLWGSTRRNIVFGDVSEEDVGISTFTFMRTPPNRRFGNMVWVEGGVNNANDKTNRSSKTSNTNSHMGTSNNSRSSSQDRSRHEGLFGGVLHKDVSSRGEAMRSVRDRVLRGPRGWLELGSGGLGLPGTANGGTSANRSMAASQETLQNYGESNGGGLAIQMEMETSVVVEIEDVPPRMPRSREPSTSMLTYDDKDMPHLPPIA